LYKWCTFFFWIQLLDIHFGICENHCNTSFINREDWTLNTIYTEYNIINKILILLFFARIYDYCTYTIYMILLRWILKWEKKLEFFGSFYTRALLQISTWYNSNMQLYIYMLYVLLCVALCQVWINRTAVSTYIANYKCHATRVAPIIHVYTAVVYYFILSNILSDLYYTTTRAFCYVYILAWSTSHNIS